MPSRRRRFLATAGSLSIGALAGCSSVSKTLGGVPGSGKLEKQKGVVEAFVTAVNENDVEAVQESVTLWAAGGFTAENIDEYTLEYEELRRTNRSDGRATLKADLTITHDGETRTDETSFRLAQYGEEWVIQSILVVGGFIINGTVLGPPPAFLESSYDADATASDGTGVLTVTHSGGGVVPAAGTTFGGTIVDPEDADPDVVTNGATLAEATDRTRFAQGDELTVGVESDYSVVVTFSKEQTDSRVSLGDFSA